MDETTTQVGGEVSASGKINEVQVGVKVNGSISRKVQSKIEREVSTRLNVQISTTTAYAEKQNLTFKAEKVTAITTS